jgi:hypothetical protein
MNATCRKYVILANCALLLLVVFPLSYLGILGEYSVRATRRFYFN